MRRFIAKDIVNYWVILDLYADDEIKDIGHQLVARGEIHYGAYCGDIARNDGLFVDYAESPEINCSGVYGKENARALAIKKRDETLKQALSKNRVVDPFGDGDNLIVVEEVTDEKRLSMDIRDLLFAKENPRLA